MLSDDADQLSWIDVSCRLPVSPPGDDGAEVSGGVVKVMVAAGEVLPVASKAVTAKL